MTQIKVVEFTDPACPFAFCAEPARLRMLWRYGDHLDWSRQMVVLSQNLEEITKRGLTTAILAGAMANLGRLHRMPIDATERSRLAISKPACRAVVATRLYAPVLESTILRALRVLTMSGHFLDDQETIDQAADSSGISAQELQGWMETPQVEAELNADMAAARAPSEAALQLKNKLAATDQGWRYTCPSYRFQTDSSSLEIPGFWPPEVYDLALANLAPKLAPREKPTDVSEVLEWAAAPLATAEVAALCAIDFDEARQELAKVATLESVGEDGYWTPR